MKGYVVALALCLGVCGCKSGESKPAEQPAAKCACPDGKCQCPECKAGDASKCSCSTKK